MGGVVGKRELEEGDPTQYRPQQVAFALAKRILEARTETEAIVRSLEEVLFMDDVLGGAGTDIDILPGLRITSQISQMLNAAPTEVRVSVNNAHSVFIRCFYKSFQICLT
jgi:hypothetical protein